MARGITSKQIWMAGTCWNMPFFFSSLLDQEMILNGFFMVRFAYYRVCMAMSLGVLRSPWESLLKVTFFGALHGPNWCCTQDVCTDAIWHSRLEVDIANLTLQKSSWSWSQMLVIFSKAGHSNPSFGMLLVCPIWVCLQQVSGRPPQINRSISMFPNKIATLWYVQGTLWLCQNSYWKLPFIVDFPIKHGDFP